VRTILRRVCEIRTEPAIPFPQNVVDDPRFFNSHGKFRALCRLERVVPTWRKRFERLF
jgi:hypothetical protein